VEALGDLLPADLNGAVTRGAHLKSAIVDRLRQFAEDVSERCAAYVARKVEAVAGDHLKRGACWQDQLENYMDQFLVNELSRRGLIPTYSFPVHYLTLEVQDGSSQGKFHLQADVALSRDVSQGISEFASGAEVVANGRIWQSAGLARYRMDLDSTLSSDANGSWSRPSPTVSSPVPITGVMKLPR